MRYLLFITGRGELAGITREEVALHGGVGEYQTILHNRAASEYMSETGIAGSMEHFEMAREHITHQVNHELMEEAKDKGELDRQRRK